MIMLSKPQMTTLVTLLLLGFPITAIHALYVVTLPSNTIYADDFENYTNGMQLGGYGCQAGSGCFGGDGGNGGWGSIDNCPGGHGGNANITNTNFMSPSHSIATWSCTSANDIFDIDKTIPLPSNRTTTVQMSVWFAVNRSYTNQQDNNAHISIETWNGTDRFEAPLFLLSKINPINNGCNTIRGIAPDFFLSSTFQGAGSDHYSGLCLSTWGQISGKFGVWHNYVITVNIVTEAVLSAAIDGQDMTSIVKGLFMQRHDGLHSDIAFQTFNPKNFIRFEIGAGNGATHVSTADNWVAWHDDLIITDVTPGQPSIIQFALRGAAWGLASMFSVIALVIGFIWIKMELEGKGYTHGGLEYKKKILRGGIMIALAIAIIW